MSNLSRIKLKGFDNIPLLKRAVLALQERGKLKDVQTAEQYAAQYGYEPVVKLYYNYNKADATDINILRQGDPLAVVLKNGYSNSELYGICATSSEHGPAGQVVGGLHASPALEKQMSEYADEIRHEMAVLGLQDTFTTVGSQYGAVPTWNSTRTQCKLEIQSQMGGF